MTNSYDVAHGLSQDEPGPLEPVEIAQLGDTLARTGNTARDQEMYAAGIRTGEENAKHNAAIRSGAAPGVSTVEDAQVPEFDLEAAAKTLAECMDYPWEWMPEKGRSQMRLHAQAIIDAARAAQRKGDA